MGLGPSPPRPSWPSWAMPAGLSAATRWCATRGWTSPSMPLTASAAPGTYRARAPRCCAGRCLRRPRPPPVPARPTMPTTSRSRPARAATGPPWRWRASSPAECAIPSRAWATPPSPRSRTWLWRRRPDHGWCVPAQASRCAAASARRPPAATAGPWTASKDRAAAHSGDTPSIILSPDPAGSVHPDKAGRPHAHPAHHHRGQGGERPGLIIVDLPSPASMRRSSPAPRSFVLALLRALHPWPRLRFGAATPPPGKVHSTNQINRSPLTGGLSTDKGAPDPAGEAAQIAMEHNLHLAVVCRVLDAPRSTVYARRGHTDPLARPGPATSISDDQLVRLLRQVLADSPFAGEGYRKLRARLRREHGVQVSGKRVLRLLRREGL